VRLILAGLGNVGRSFLRVLDSQATLLRQRYGLECTVVGAADSAGAALDPGGLDRGAVLAVKQGGGSVGSLPVVGYPGMSGLDLVQSLSADAVLESTPVDLRTGQPGLDITRAALRNGVAVVLANKGPLALAYAELAALSDLADFSRPALRFSACVGGAMPTINLGLRDLAGARILRVEAVLNGTTQFLLRAMEQGRSYSEVLAEAQRRGLTETDPSLDVEGWDAASKLVIVANAVLRQPAAVADVEVEGIAQVTPAMLRAAVARGERIVLLCLAEPMGDGAETFRLSVRPTAIPLDHPLARMDGEEMGVVYHTDIAGRASATSFERDPLPTASAMLRDLLEIAGRSRRPLSSRAARL
jgi:homoserine dehydrogenase